MIMTECLGWKTSQRVYKFDKFQNFPNQIVLKNFAALVICYRFFIKQKKPGNHP